MRFASLREEVGRWQNTLWPSDQDRPDMLIVKAAKLAEEVGEVCGAVIKLTEGRKTLRDAEDELGDVLIVAAELAETGGFDPNFLERRWAEVSQRTYGKRTTAAEALAPHPESWEAMVAQVRRIRSKETELDALRHDS